MLEQENLLIGVHKTTMLIVKFGFGMWQVYDQLYFMAVTEALLS